jgi:hypothetical protein
VALATRLWGIDWQLPAALYFDEMKYVAWAGDAKDDASQAVTDLRNPTFFHHLLQIEYAVASVTHRGATAQQTAVFELWLARVTSALLGALTCMVTGLAASALARAVGGLRSRSATTASTCQHDAVWAGLAAGLILAFAPLHVHLSHYAINDAAASLFLALTLLFGTRALAGGGRHDLLLAGLAAGLGFSTKYSFAVGLVLPLLGVVLAPGALTLQTSHRGGALTPQPPLPTVGEGEPAAPVPSRGEAETMTGRDVACGARWRPELARRGQLLLLVLVGFVLGAVLGAPEIVLSPSAIVTGVVEQARIGGTRWNGQSDAPIWQLYAETLVQGLGWPALVFALAGAAALWRRSRVALVAELAVPLICLAVMLRQELFFARFALPLLPSLAMLAGVGVVALAGLTVRGHRARPASLAILTSLVLLAVMSTEIVTTVRHNQLATTTDTRVLARRWLQQRGDGARVATELYGQPLLWTGSVAPRGFRLQRVASFMEPSTVTKLACDGTRYFLVTSITSEREIARRGSRSRESGYDLLTRSARPVTTFDPFRPGATAPAHPDNTGIPFWYLDAYARPGPKITVYDLPEGAIPCTAGGR